MINYNSLIHDGEYSEEEKILILNLQQNMENTLRKKEDLKENIEKELCVIQNLQVLIKRSEQLFEQQVEELKITESTLDLLQKQIVEMILYKKGRGV